MTAAVVETEAWLDEHVKPWLAPALESVARADDPIQSLVEALSSADPPEPSAASGPSPAHFRLRGWWRGSGFQRLRLGLRLVAFPEALVGLILRITGVPERLPSLQGVRG